MSGFYHFKLQIEPHMLEWSSILWGEESEEASQVPSQREICESPSLPLPAERLINYLPKDSLPLLLSCKDSSAQADSFPAPHSLPNA